MFDKNGTFKAVSHTSVCKHFLLQPVWGPQCCISTSPQVMPGLLAAPGLARFHRGPQMPLTHSGYLVTEASFVTSLPSFSCSPSLNMYPGVTSQLTAQNRVYLEKTQLSHPQHCTYASEHLSPATT